MRYVFIMCMSIGYFLCMACCLLLYVVAWILIYACWSFMIEFRLRSVHRQVYPVAGLACRWLGMLQVSMDILWMDGYIKLRRNH
jgi:hypothetical protein